MSLEWFEFHPKSFLTDTMRLNTEAKGAYLLLLLDYYEKEGPAPDDDDVLAAITGLPLEAWQRHRKVIQTLFAIEGGLWVHRTCETVIADAKARIARQSAAGKEAANRRWNKDAKRNADRTANRNANRMPDAMPSASETHTERNAIAEADFGPSVTAPSHNGGDDGTEIPNNANRMRSASEAQCETHAERYAIEMHTSQFTERREGANAPSPASVDLIGSLIDPAFQPKREVIAEAINVDGATSDELAAWLDDWKQRCLDAGTRNVDWHAAWGREYHRRMLERAAKKPKPRVAVSKAPKAEKRLLPLDWRARPEDREFAIENGFDPDRIEAHFRDVWTAGAYKHANHDATFRNFIRSEKQRGNSHGQAPQRRAPAPGGSILDAAARFEQRLDAATGRAPAQDQPHGDAAVLSLPEE